MAEHEWHNPCSRINSDDHYSCMWCDGGLECCKKCGAFEGATPDDCPEVRLQPDELDAIHKGLRNFRDGQWRNECAAVMRPIYDRENWMREHGYIPGPPHPISGGETWVELTLVEPPC